MAIKQIFSGKIMKRDSVFQRKELNYKVPVPFQIKISFLSKRNRLDEVWRMRT